MLSGIECRLNFENRPVRSRDIKEGPKQPPATNRGSQEPATNRVNLGSVTSFGTTMSRSQKSY